MKLTKNITLSVSEMEQIVRQHFGLDDGFEVFLEPVEDPIKPTTEWFEVPENWAKPSPPYHHHDGNYEIVFLNRDVVVSRLLRYAHSWDQRSSNPIVKYRDYSTT